MTTQPREEVHIRIELTPEQQAEISMHSGLQTPFLELTRRELIAFMLVAKAAHSDSLPVTSSAVRQMMAPLGARSLQKQPCVVTVPLTPAQRAYVQQATEQAISSLRVAPDDFACNYREHWSEGAQPFNLGRSMVVVPAGYAYEAAPGEHVIALPGKENAAENVFGTGKHPATQLALCLVEEHVRAGDRVLDLGTGSGILAVAAALLGARRVLALDIAPASVGAAQATVAANGLAAVIEVREGSIDAATPPYEVVVANIIAAVLVRLAPDLAAALAPGGTLIVSGIIAARAADIEDALTAAGLQKVEQRALNDWRALAFGKRL